MTTEELIKPRYKVIADYPEPRNHPYYEVGCIIRAITKEDIEYLTKYKYLFRPLQWWEDRKPDEMPEYVKCIKTPDQIIQPGGILKVNWHGEGNGRVDNGQWVFCYTNCYVPATKEEHEAYITPLTS